MNKELYRIENDSMGAVKVPKNAYWDAQTQRALENFPRSGIRFPEPFIKAPGIVKMYAAKVNMELGKLDKRLGNAIVKASS